LFIKDSLLDENIKYKIYFYYYLIRYKTDKTKNQASNNINKIFNNIIMLKLFVYTHNIPSIINKIR
jgi:hypothetical protein